MKVKTGSTSTLVTALATVAIAALAGGPVSAGGTALTTAIAVVQAKIEANAPSRDLLRRISTAVGEWARAEKISPDAVTLGLTEAARVLSGCGLDMRAIVDLGFDANLVAETVIARARTLDMYWGKEDHYAVAERAIHVTYEALIERLEVEEPIVIPLLESVREDLKATLQALEGLSRQSATIEAIAASLVTVSTTADVIRYLEKRLDDWDRASWLGEAPAPSILERRLKVHPSIVVEFAEAEVFSADDALDRPEQLMMILGGPGSGKTWLMRRLARAAAQSALAELKRGANVDEVQIPLFTTWERWKSGGELRQSLFAAAFSPGLGHSDLGGSEIVDRLKRTLTSEGSRVLLLIDSLDEAADKQSQDDKLRELGSLVGWRVVVSSRPAALRTVSVGSGGPLVLTLEELSFPDDVEGFIREWFAHQPERGEQLRKQITHRDELRRSAVVPLFLTFYCLLSDGGTADAAGLPISRWELYRKLIRRLFLGRWAPGSPGPDLAPDLDYCERLMREWAWEAATERTSWNGFSQWGETFVPSVRPVRDARAIDHVAPKVSENDELEYSRRFIHRTVQEHLAAEHIASMDPAEAVDMLLPHLWYDSDWDVVIPAAIAAHHRQYPGVLLELLLARTSFRAPDLARREAQDVLVRLLVSVAAEAAPGSWAPSSTQGGLSRQRNCILAAWKGALHDGNFFRSTGDVRAALELTAEERKAAREIALTVLPSGGDLGVIQFMETYTALVSVEDWHLARSELLGPLRNIPTSGVAEVIEFFLTLNPTEDERRQARAEILASMDGLDPWWSENCIRGLLALDPTEQDAVQARDIILDVLATLSGEKVYAAEGVVAAFEMLRPIEDERVKARKAVLKMLDGLSGYALGEVDSLVTVLLSLGPSDEDRVRARALVVDAFAGMHAHDVGGLVAALEMLGPSEQECAQARRLVMRVLREADQYDVESVAAGLEVLDPTEPERAEARIILTRSSRNRGLRAQRIDAFLTQGRDAQERAESLSALSEPQEPRSPVPHQELPLLEIRGQEGARRELLNYLARGQVIGNGQRIAEAVLASVRTEPERATLRRDILALVVGARFGGALALARVLMGCVVTEQERAGFRRELLLQLSSARAEAVVNLVRVLNVLGPVEEERVRARRAVLEGRRRVESWRLRYLVEAWESLVVSDYDREHARRCLMAVLSEETDPLVVRVLVPALRRLSTHESWMAWLTSSASDLNSPVLA